MLPRSSVLRVALLAAAAGLALLPVFASPYYVELGSYALISAMLADAIQISIEKASAFSLIFLAYRKTIFALGGSRLG